MQPIAHQLDLNTLRRQNSRPRQPWLKPKTGSGVGAIIETSFAQLLLMVLLLQLFSGCVSLAYFEGDYHGKVIDAETLQPIQSAVVLGVWSKMYGTAGGPVYDYYDARETMTDRNGEFTIKGMGPRTMTHLQKMKIIIFKAGYEDFVRSDWEEVKSDEQTLWEGEKAIIPLKKLQEGQSRRRFIPYIGDDVPMNKQKLFREEVNKQIHGSN